MNPRNQAMREMTRNRKAAREMRPTAQQRGLWFIQTSTPQTCCYNLVFSARVLPQGPMASGLDVAALRRTFRVLTRRHEALRSNFLTRDGEPVLTIWEPSEADSPAATHDGSGDGSDVDTETGTEDGFAVHDAQGFSQESVRDLSLGLSRKPFRLDADPLLRVDVVDWGDHGHILILAAHHISLDFWSLALLLEEMKTVYAAELRGLEAALPPPSAALAEYGTWQASLLDSPQGEAQLAFWEGYLGKTPEALDLPTDFQRPALQAFRGASEPFALDADLTSALKALAKNEAATLFITLLSAFQVFLHRLSGQPVIYVGSPVSGRLNREFRGIIGNLVNTMVLKGDLTEDPDFRTYLKQIMSAMSNAVRHQEYPFPILVERLKTGRDPSRSPVFQAGFAWERITQFKELEELFSAQGRQVRYGDLAMAPFALPQQEGQADLSLEMGGESEGRLFGYLKYNPDLFRPETIRRMKNHLMTLLRSITADPGAAVSRLPLLSSAERGDILELGRGPVARHGTPEAAMTIHGLFERQASATPEVVAVSFGDRTLTYRELDFRADALCARLRRAGAGPHAPVALCVERSPEMVVGLLGILKSGAGYLPLDPNYPKDRIAYVIADAGTEILVTQESLSPSIGAGVATVILIGEIDTMDASEPDQAAAGPSVAAVPMDKAAQPPATDADSLAYVIYTSGSTGKPKGVEVLHGNVVNFLQSMAAQPGLAARDVLLAVTTLSFDIAGLEMFLPLSRGAQVAIVDRETAMDGSALAKALIRTGATFMQATPITWRLLIETGWSGDGKLKALCGGEAMPPELAGELLSRCGSVWNMYGPTETTIWSTLLRVEQGRGLVAIGKPILNTAVYVLDKHAEPAPLGVPGELCIGGAGVARGYRGKPELTEARFPEDPFAPGARMYRTGDLVRLRADGILDFLGRLDQQVKIRGYRIELGEIESVLSGHPDVADAVVAAREDAPGGKRLVAYWIARPGHTVEESRLRDFLKASLPAYMVPSAFVAMEAFPQTPNGKVARNLLPAPAASHAGAKTRIAPRDSFEIRLAGIWSEALGLEDICITENFFDLGGHSLLAMRLMARIKTEFAVDLPASALFQSATIEQLAKAIRKQSQQEPESAGGTEGDGEALIKARSPLVPIKVVEGSVPVFCPHPIGGNVFCYVALSKRLGARHSLYGLQAQGLDAEQDPLVSVEDMAETYIRAMRGLRPRGPYRLAGWCFGGLIAFEMAKQLKAAGEEVEYLALLDTRSPLMPEEFSDIDDDNLLSWFARDLAIPFGKKLDIPAEELRLLPGDGKFAFVLDKIKAERILPEDTEPDRLKQYFQVYLANAIALQGYSPGPYDGRILLLRARDEAPHRLGRNLGWEAYCDGLLEVRDVPGDHNTMMFEPFVAGAGSEMSESLDDITAVAAPSEAEALA